ncbi:MAG: hypothetical protein ACRDTA_11240 [Pseudonocardiaceae bacterium]
MTTPTDQPQAHPGISTHNPCLHHQPDHVTAAPQQESQPPAADALAEHVRAVVDSFPPLTPEQKHRIAALLRTTVPRSRPASE